jgi:hypothetical protein
MNNVVIKQIKEKVMKKQSKQNKVKETDVTFNKVLEEFCKSEVLIEYQNASAHMVNSFRKLVEEKCPNYDSKKAIKKLWEVFE